MFRTALMGFGVALFLAGIALGVVMCPPGTFFAPIAIPPLVLGVLVTGGLLLERHRYRAIADKPPTEPGWEMMAERFVDPGTDELMIVWYNRRTGKRLYVRSGRA